MRLLRRLQAPVNEPSVVTEKSATKSVSSFQRMRLHYKQIKQVEQIEDYHVEELRQAILIKN
jgi:hypothetical protein